MTNSDIFTFDGPDEPWWIETTNGFESVTGRFILNVLGDIMWFQTTDSKVYFMSGIISAQREKDKEAKLNPY